MQQLPDCVNLAFPEMGRSPPNARLHLPYDNLLDFPRNTELLTNLNGGDASHYLSQRGHLVASLAIERGHDY